MRLLRDQNGVQRLRSRKEPSTVGQYIRIANDVPMGPGSDPMTRHLEDPLIKWWLSGGLLTDLSEAEIAETCGDARDVARSRWLKKIETTVESWGESGRAYVMGPRESETHNPEDVVFDMQKRYTLAISIRDLLSSIAEENETSPRENAAERIYRLPYSVELVSTLSLRMTQSDPRATAKEPSRRAVIEPPEPLARLLEEVELGRIKRCAYEKCRKIFWAGRLDRPCCSDSCRNAYKQKRHRDRDRENRPYKQFLKKRSTPK
jgi:hypothetical protein